MIILASLTYFIVIVFGALLLLYPNLRTRLAGSWSGLRRATGGRMLAAARHAGGSAGRSAGVLFDLAGSGIAYAGQRPLALTCGTLLVMVPAVLVLVFKAPTLFQFDEQAYTPHAQISQLLAGEQLFPPPPLLPETFLTPEVTQLRPEVATASRNWGQMDAEFNQRLLLVFKLMREQHGYEMALLEGYRSPQRQQRLAEQGPHITKAGANMSFHQYGLAADCAFYRDGKLVISESDPWAMRGYTLYGQIAESVGLTWGGRWKMGDLGHVELRRKGVLGRALETPAS